MSACVFAKQQQRTHTCVVFWTGTSVRVDLGLLARRRSIGWTEPVPKTPVVIRKSFYRSGLFRVAISILWAPMVERRARIGRCARHRRRHSAPNSRFAIAFDCRSVRAIREESRHTRHRPTPSDLAAGFGEALTEAAVAAWLPAPSECAGTPVSPALRRGWCRWAG